MNAKELTQVPEVDWAKLRADVSAFSATKKAKADILKVESAVEAYNENVGRVLRGEAVWQDGSSTIVNRLPSEFSERLQRARQQERKAEVAAFDQKVAPVVGPRLEARRRRVEQKATEFVAEMAALAEDEGQVRALRPRGSTFHVASADLDFANSVALDLWRKKA